MMGAVMLIVFCHCQSALPVFYSLIFKGTVTVMHFNDCTELLCNKKFTAKIV